MQYKILTKRDSRFFGTFDTEALEAELNDYATDGWRVAQSLLSASIWKTSKAEIVVILERPVD